MFDLEENNSVTWEVFEFMGSKGQIVQANDIKALITDLRELILTARNAVSRSVDTIQVITNFRIGLRIVEHEQEGSKRAKYGKQVLKVLSDELTAEFGRGFSKDNLYRMRKFYLTYKARVEALQVNTSKVGEGHTNHLVPEQFPIFETLSQKFNTSKLSSSSFVLSWSHYVFLIGIKTKAERDFYEIEAVQEGSSLRELRRLFDSSLYERLALSRDKESIRKLSQEGQVISEPQDVLKEPLVLEFLGLEERARYSESDLETAIVNKLQPFLLELGKGFLFEARQKRFTFDDEHFFVDLVFYNRLLRCYVLIDLKIGKLTHQDLGQMQMYVNYFDRYVKDETENPTVGIVLCKKKRDALVQITLPESANIHAKEYSLYLPDKEELRQKLIDWTEDQDFADNDE